MMIGLISDIHANEAALHAVLSALKPMCEMILCAGDLVGYYRQPNEVCELMRSEGITCVRGNHDAYVLGELAPNEGRRDAYRTDWTAQTLSAPNKDWLKSLPIERKLVIDGLPIWLRHASPWDEETYLYPDSASLEDVVLDEGVFLIVGHTHHPLCRKVGGGFIVNPGSVGQPRDWNPMASFATLCTESREASFHRVEYDVVDVQNELRREGWPETSITLLSRKRD